ncbi:pyrophosphate-energized vacuolar membrane proton pump-like [Olea europaea subsp. europaea]|uniref:Pyrophosphate-energized vacuolar membrane proton pump-like n=1 Tax=Olea europaea subsp. europaea TaxID=158383 RepID=A0A8S0QMH2_OLEEU|nr:pyrophosphate-energized vacuolar membrane proton pump-like [Olea europaea subsp. europaea]
MEARPMNPSHESTKIVKVLNDLEIIRPESEVWVHADELLVRFQSSNLFILLCPFTAPLPLLRRFYLLSPGTFQALPLFALVKWLFVPKIKLVPEVSNSTIGKNFTDSLLKEEEGINERSIVHKCAKIQSAINEGIFLAAQVALVF